MCRMFLCLFVNMTDDDDYLVLLFCALLVRSLEISAAAVLFVREIKKFYTICIILV